MAEDVSFHYDGRSVLGQDGRRHVEKVTFDSSITKIGECAFYHCTSLQSIDIPPSITKIELAAFAGCLSLKSIDIPSSVTKIESHAFSYCTSLQSIDIPSSVTKIESGAFRHCHSLQSVVIPPSITKIESSAFSICTSLQSVVIPPSITKIGESAFENCTSLQSVVIPPSITKIESSAFSYCTSLQSVVIPSSVTKIESNAFKKCTSLQSVVIPPSVTEIESDAFRGCTSLQSIVIPSSVTTIESDAFSHCTSLKSIIIESSSTTTISHRAFLDCTALSSVTLPPTVTLEGVPFLNCRNLDQKSIVTINDCPNTFTKKLNDTFQHGPGPEYDFKGHTQKDWGPHMWGITLQQIEDIMNHPLIKKDTLMRDVVKILIKPTTKKQGVGYALLINQNKPLHAKVMVSHAWDEPIGQFYICLKNSGLKGPFWICAFSIYQSDGEGDSPTIAEQLGDEPEYGPFSTELKAADSMIAVVTDICDIYTRLWCVFELAEAQRLKVNVRLCPHIDDIDVLQGDLSKDVCIKNIEKSVDSINAYCSMESDRESIHKAILTEGGFERINHSVERIRLEYLLRYPVHKIANPGPDCLYKIGLLFGIKSRYITVLVYSLIVGIAAYSFGFLLGVIVFPLVGLFLDVLVRWIGHEGLTSRWENYTEGRTLGRDIFHVIIYYFIIMPLLYISCLGTIRDNKKEGFETLASAIVSVVKRVYSLNDDDIPNYQEHCETWSRLYYWAPLFVFWVWNKKVERLMKERDGTIKASVDTTIIVDNIAANKSTPLLNTNMA